MKLPPPLAWLASFSASIGAAVDATVTATAEKTINPLVFKVVISFSSPMPPKQMMIVWNLFQQFVKANNEIVQNRPSMNGRQLTVDVGVKHRLGPPKTKHPLG